MSGTTRQAVCPTVAGVLSPTGNTIFGSVLCIRFATDELKCSTGWRAALVCVSVFSTTLWPPNITKQSHSSLVTAGPIHQQSHEGDGQRILYDTRVKKSDLDWFSV